MILGNIIEFFNLITRPRIRGLHTRTRRLKGTTGRIMNRLITGARTLTRILIGHGQTLLTPNTLTLFRLRLMVLLHVATQHLTTRLRHNIKHFLTVTRLTNGQAIFITELRRTRSLVSHRTRINVIMSQMHVSLNPTVVNILKTITT